MRVFQLAETHSHPINFAWSERKLGGASKKGQCWCSQYLVRGSLLTLFRWIFYRLAIVKSAINWWWDDKIEWEGVLSNCSFISTIYFNWYVLHWEVCNIRYIVAPTLYYAMNLTRKMPKSQSFLFENAFAKNRGHFCDTIH